jgi:hypothetical protein
MAGSLICNNIELLAWHGMAWHERQEKFDMHFPEVPSDLHERMFLFSLILVVKRAVFVKMFRHCCSPRPADMVKRRLPALMKTADFRLKSKTVMHEPDLELVDDMKLLKTVHKLSFPEPTPFMLNGLESCMPQGQISTHPHLLPKSIKRISYSFQFHSIHPW